MDRRKKPDQEYWEESIHTSLSYWFCVIAIGIEFFLGIKYIGEYFGQMCLVEAFFGVSGLIITELIHKGFNEFKIYPKPFKREHKNTFIRFAITFGVIVAIQLIFQIVPLVTSTDMALGIVFCAVVEEYFFRGLFMEIAFKAGRNSKSKITIWKYNPEKEKPDKLISYVEIAGIFLSGSVFAAFHVNYYSQPNLMWMVFVGGCWLAFVYFWNKDLTAVILSHFLLNIVFVYQFWMVTGLG